MSNLYADNYQDWVEHQQAKGRDTSQRVTACFACLYCATCPGHDPDGSIWRATHKGEQYFDLNGVLRTA